MIKIKNKKGAAHVEMIISFVIFISFLAFILIVFRPFKIFSKSTSALDITETEIIDYVSVNLSVSSLKINSSVSTGKSCFFVDLARENPIIIKDENGRIRAKRQDNKIYFENSGYFYKLYSSEELIENDINTADCENLEEGNYTLGVIKFYKKISYSELVSFNESYYNNYEQLKENLGLRNDFNMIIGNNSGILFECSRYKPSGIEIMAKETSIEILDSNADLSPAILNIQVWD